MAMVTSMSVSWRVHPSKYFRNAFITQDTRLLSNIRTFLEPPQTGRLFLLGTRDDWKSRVENRAPAA